MNNTLKVMILMMQIIYVVDDLIVLNTMGNVIPCLPFIPQFIFFVPHGDGHSQSEYYDTNIHHNDSDDDGGIGYRAATCRQNLHQGQTSVRLLTSESTTNYLSTSALCESCNGEAAMINCLILHEIFTFTF